MAVARRDAPAMADARVVAVAAVPARDLDGAGVRRADPRPARRGDVDAGVQPAPAHPEGGGEGAVDGPDEASAPPADRAGGAAVQRSLDARLLALHRGQVLLGLAPLAAHRAQDPRLLGARVSEAELDARDLVAVRENDGGDLLLAVLELGQAVRGPL